MKYAIMSDIHGNLEAFKAAVSDARKRGCGMMVCLGDLTGYGDQSRECVDFAMKTMDVCLMGNHDKIVPGARYVVNVGSVGLPRKGSRASYCVYDSRNHELQLVYLK